MWSIHTAVKGNKLLTEATTWMNLENVMPVEIGQSKKDKYYMIRLYQASKI